MRFKFDNHWKRRNGITVLQFFRVREMNAACVVLFNFGFSVMW